jgi:hypothetical protein
LGADERERVSRVVADEAQLLVEIGRPSIRAERMVEERRRWHVSMPDRPGVPVVTAAASRRKEPSARLRAIAARFYF